MSAATAVATRRGLTGPALLTVVFLLTTITGIGFHTAEILFTDSDPYRYQGPVESIGSIAMFGTVELLLTLAIVLPLRKDPGKAKVGAIVLGVLALLTLPLFWSGAPAIFGAGAAWLAGLVKGVEPQTGAARGFGVVGLVLAALLIVATPVLYIATIISAGA